MRRYVIRRLLQAVVLLFILSIIFFLLIHAMGSPIDILIGPRVTKQTIQNLIHKYGLDQPLPVQYWDWLTTILRGNLGNSFLTGQPVIQELGSRLPATLELMGAGMGMALLVGLLLGVIAGARQYSITDYAVTVLSYLGISMPVFWFGLIVQELLGVQLHLFPVFGIASADTTGFDQFQLVLDRLTHVISPALVLSLAYMANWSRYLRSSMLETVRQDYIRTARAKGLSPRVVFFRHALRNALIPFVTVVALNLPELVGGATITETIFAWPGIGQFFFGSLTGRDFPVLLGILLMVSVAVITFNLLADVIYGLLDPRISYS